MNRTEILNFECLSQQKRWLSARRVSIRPKKAHSTTAGRIETRFLRLYLELLEPEEVDG